MSRRRYYNDRADDIWQPISGLLSFGIIWLAFKYYTDRVNFYIWISYITGYGMGAILLVVCVYFSWLWIRMKRYSARIMALFEQIKSSGQEDYINNFINRFGFDKLGKGVWSFRKHNIDFDRIKDLEKVLKEKGIKLEEKDIYIILKHFIQDKEEGLTRESMGKVPQKFAQLSGTDFEKLLFRLFEAMGYKTEWIGRSGDQGGDLIANKASRRILIQAKCYRNWSVGNVAVQQVVAAMKYYDCNETMVISTSDNFTSEAFALAKVNHTELISKDRLSELLLQYLHESWV